jgi:bile acid:Na+ symporter, BASS family
MDSALTSVGLPVALAVIMFGLGLALTPADFARTARQPRAVVVALVAQVAVLPLVAFGLVVAVDADPLVAVGMMLLAASPGGTTANLFSHLFRGDVALNITLTAVNSVLAVVTLPLVVNLAVGWFDPPGADDLGLQFGKTLQVFAIVLVPVALGMLVRSRSAAFADRADRPVRIGSAVLLVLVIAGALLAEREDVGDYLAEVGLLTTAFCVLSLSVGYVLPRAAGVREDQALASAFEVGIHNSTLAIAVAISVLDDDRLAVPAAVYGILMFPLAALAGLLITRRWSSARAPRAPHPAPDPRPPGRGDRRR